MLMLFPPFWRWGRAPNRSAGGAAGGKKGLARAVDILFKGGSALADLPTGEKERSGRALTLPPRAKAHGFGLKGHIAVNVTEC